MERPQNPGRFKPGVSGNPRGRPKKQAKHKSESVLQRPVTISFAGTTLKVSRPEAILLSLAANGFKGEKAALETFLMKAEHFRGALSGLPSVIKTRRIIVRPGTCDVAFSELGILTEVDGHSGIAMWVLKEAIRRKPSLNLSGLDRSAVLAPLESKSLAEKLLRPHGLAAQASDSSRAN